MQRHHNSVPRKGIGIKHLVDAPRHQLGELVQAGNARLLIIDIIPEFKVPDIIQPASRVYHPARFCGRQVQDKCEQPQQGKYPHIFYPRGRRLSMKGCIQKYNFISNKYRSILVNIFQGHVYCLPLATHLVQQHILLRGLFQRYFVPVPFIYHLYPVGVIFIV